MRRLSLFLPGLLVALACSGDDPAHPRVDASVEQPDGPPADGSTSGDGDEQPGGPSGLPAAIRGSVVGKLYGHCPGNTERQTDLSSTPIEALVSDGSGGHRGIAGVGRANGTFQIDGVPEGRYLLHLGGLAYIDTDQRVIDDFGRLPIRCAPAPATTAAAGTTVSFDLAGMTPFASGSDRIDVGAMSLGYSPLLAGTAAPADATSFTAPLPWVGNRASAPLPDASFADDITVLHSRRLELPDTTGLRHFAITRLVDWFQTSAVTVRAGESTRVAGEFLAATGTRSATVAIDLAQLEDGRRGMAANAGPQVILSAQPARGDFLAGTPAVLASLDLFDRSHSADRTLRADFTYADPFPASWQRTATLQMFTARIYRRPGRTDISSLGTIDHVTRPYAPSSALDFAPIAAPTTAKVGAVDFFAGGTVHFDGRTAVRLTWDGVTDANSYRIGISAIPTPDQPATMIAVAVLFTDRTTIDVPAQLLRNHTFYGITIQATQSTPDFASGHFSFFTVPGKSAAIASGRLRVDATCGDGVIQSGEECDDTVETATCNADCTRPSCGDSIVNATAGEACDTGTSTPECDSDCTLPRCGDDVVNSYREDCELGDAGCAADCHFTN